MNTTRKATQFTLTDKGSSWKPTKVTYKLKHKKQTKTITSEIGVKLSPGLAKSKGLTVWGQPVK